MTPDLWYAQGLCLTMQARAFLPIIMEYLDTLNADELLNGVYLQVAPLYNGRERGYVVMLYPPAAEEVFHLFFAEHRCSDDFFIWTWEAPGSPKLPPDVGDDNSYANRVCVPYLRFDKARDVATKRIEDWLYRVKEEEKERKS